MNRRWKTARDSLDCLPRQVPLYEALLLRCPLAVTPCHLEDAPALMPEAWGVIVLDVESHAVTEARRAPVVRPRGRPARTRWATG